ncbi:MAG TPA: sialidase family protein [Actinomycetota bacterium]|nr:sialidase family protein [Actinomycetota bacterium]
MDRVRDSKIRSLLFLSLMFSSLLLLAPAASDAAAACRAPGEALKFDKQKYIDMTRAGGEPTVEQHPDGTLMYGSHAGTTHFYSPAAADPTTAAFVENYTGQTYYYFSKDHGKTWTFQERTLPPNNSPMSGFSDPEYAIDETGQVYVSEINLLNVAVSKAPGSDEPFVLQNFFGQTISDRQWMEADKKDVLYLVGNELGGGTFPNDPVGNAGHYLHRSTDGGQTFTPGVEDGAGLGDLQIDRRDGTLYEAYYDDGVLSMTAYREARSGNLDKRETNEVAKGVSMLSHWPSFDIDSAGNQYMTWDESGQGDRPAGVWFSYSTDGGRTWAKPTRVDKNTNTDIWPWLAVGDKGKVAVAWLGADTKLPGHDAETQGDQKWRIYVAQTLNGLGCKGSSAPGFRVTTATSRPVHTSTICQGGTACQAAAIDRRLGDFFTIEIDNSGHVWGGYSDTAEGGATALPGFVHQSGGIPFIKQRAGAATNGSGAGASDAGGSTQNSGGDSSAGGAQQADADSEVAGSAQEPSSLAATGAAILGFVALGLALVVGGWYIKRHSATRV